MWKSEQFGLGFLSEVNHDFVASRGAAAPVNWLDRFDMFSTTTYATFAVLNVGLVIAWHGTLEGHLNGMSASDVGARELVVVGSNELAHMAASIVASHSLLLLETVLHSTPTIHPFDWLEHLLRVIAALFCVAEGLTSAELLAGYE